MNLAEKIGIGWAAACAAVPVLHHLARRAGMDYEASVTRWAADRAPDRAADAAAARPGWRDGWNDLADATREIIICGCTYWDNAAGRPDWRPCPQHADELAARRVSDGAR